MGISGDTLTSGNKKHVLKRLIRHFRSESNQAEQEKMQINDPYLEMQSDFLFGTGTGCLASALTTIYRRLYSDKWNKFVPDPSGYKDFEFLYFVNDEYIAFHRKHEKFGENIVEFGVNDLQNAFCFFDYSRLPVIFEWYDNHSQQLDTQGPSVPTYYAFPKDRYFYGTESQQWDD